MIFFLESFLGCITNYAYNKENIIRMNEINNAKSNKIKTVAVSHYTIIPTRITYALTPKQDRVFLTNLSKIHKIDINFDDSYPRSKKIRKQIKFFIDDLLD